MTDEPTVPSSRPPESRRSLPALFIWILVLMALLGLAISIFRPFFTPIVIALVLTTVGQPFFAWILRRIGPTRRGIAAAATCLAIVIALIIPGAWITWSLAVQAPASVRMAADGAVRFTGWLGEQPWFGRLKSAEWFDRYWSGLEKSLKAIEKAHAPGGAPGQEAIEPPPVPDPGEGGSSTRPAGIGLDFVEWITRSVGNLLQNAMEVFLQFFLMLFILFYFLRDGPDLLRSFQRGLPLELESQEEVVRTFNRVSGSIIRGSLGTAAAQGAAATIAFLIVGIPAVFGGVMVALCSLIPPVGTGIILLPVTVYLFADGNWGKGIFMAIVTFGISLLDNVLRPFLVGRTLSTHPIWLFLSILGGISAFGPMGILYGPMVLVLLGTVFTLFVRDEGSQPPARPA